MAAGREPVWPPRPPPALVDSDLPSDRVSWEPTPSQQQPQLPPPPPAVLASDAGTHDAAPADGTREEHDGSERSDDGAFVSVLAPYVDLLQPAGPPSVDLPALWLHGNNHSDWELRLQAFTSLHTQLSHPNAIAVLTPVVDKLTALLEARIQDPHHKVAVAVMETLGRLVPALAQPLVVYLERLVCVCVCACVRV